MKHNLEYKIPSTFGPNGPYSWASVIIKLIISIHKGYVIFCVHHEISKTVKTQYFSPFWKWSCPTSISHSKCLKLSGFLPAIRWSSFFSKGLSPQQQVPNQTTNFKFLKFPPIKKDYFHLILTTFSELLPWKSITQVKSG